MAEAVFVQDGLAVDYTPAADVAAGTVIVQGDLVGVVTLDTKAGQPGALTVEGVFDFAKPAGTAINVGVLLYWDDALNVVSTAPAGKKLIGKAIRAAAAADATVRARLSQ